MEEALDSGSMTQDQIKAKKTELESLFGGGELSLMSFETFSGSLKSKFWTEILNIFIIIRENSSNDFHVSLVKL